MSLDVFFKSRNSLLTAFCKGSAEREKLKNNIKSIKKFLEEKFLFNLSFVAITIYFFTNLMIFIMGINNK